MKKELNVIVTYDGHWVVTEKQKRNSRGFSPAMPVSALTQILMSNLGIKREFGKNIVLKISFCEEKKNEKTNST